MAGDSRTGSKASLRVLLPPGTESPAIAVYEGSWVKRMRDFLGADLSVVVNVPVTWSPVQGPIYAGDLYDAVYRALLVKVLGPNSAVMLGAVGWLQFGWYDAGDDRFLGSAGHGQAVVVGVEYLWTPGLSPGEIAYSAVAVPGVYQRLAVAFWPRSRIPAGVAISCEFYF